MIVISNEYGKELGLFEFDYLGGHSALEMVLLNAKILVFEKGLQILNGLSNDFLFVEWHNIVSCTINGKVIILTVPDGIIKLESNKKGNTTSFEKIIKTVSDIEIKYISKIDNLRSIEGKRSEKLFSEQERRVNNFVKSCRSKNVLKIGNAWSQYLEQNLQFPFEAEIIDEPEPLEIGDIIKVTGIDGYFDLYGIIVNTRKGRKKYSFPLCLLESAEKRSKNYQLIDDYNWWFSNL